MGALEGAGLSPSRPRHAYGIVQEDGRRFLTACKRTLKRTHARRFGSDEHVLESSSVAAKASNKTRRLRELSKPYAVDVEEFKTLHAGRVVPGL